VVLLSMAGMFFGPNNRFTIGYEKIVDRHQQRLWPGWSERSIHLRVHRLAFAQPLKTSSQRLSASRNDPAGLPLLASIAKAKPYNAVAIVPRVAIVRPGIAVSSIIMTLRVVTVGRAMAVAPAMPRVALMVVLLMVTVMSMITYVAGHFVAMVLKIPSLGNCRRGKTDSKDCGYDKWCDEVFDIHVLSPLPTPTRDVTYSFSISVRPKT
jgi:hypothetical protein